MTSQQANAEIRMTLFCPYSQAGEVEARELLNSVLSKCTGHEAMALAASRGSIEVVGLLGQEVINWLLGGAFAAGSLIAAGFLKKLGERAADRLQPKHSKIEQALVEPENLEAPHPESQGLTTSLDRLSFFQKNLMAMHEAVESMKEIYPILREAKKTELRIIIPGVNLVATSSLAADVYRCSYQSYRDLAEAMQSFDVWPDVSRTAAGRKPSEEEMGIQQLRHELRKAWQERDMLRRALADSAD